MDHYLGHGRRLKRTMRALGYPTELLTAWIDELAPGRRAEARPVPEELKRKAVVAAASGRSEYAMPPPDWAWRRPSSGNWKRQMLAGSRRRT
ncbi:MAG: hypothetical protein ACLTTU_14445 [Bilophila wadsworthia]